MQELRIIKNTFYLRSLWGGGGGGDSKLFIIKKHLEKVVNHFHHLHPREGIARTIQHVIVAFTVCSDLSAARTNERAMLIRRRRQSS
jgi:hypothetical protein